MNNQNLTPSDEELMLLMDGKANEELKQHIKNNPELLSMVEDVQQIEAWLTKKLHQPSPEQITAYALGELTQSERAYIEALMEIDEDYRMEVEASIEFFASEVEDQDDEIVEQRSEIIYLDAIIQRTPLSSQSKVAFRDNDDPFSSDAEPIRAIAEGVEISVTIRTTPTQYIITGSVIAEDEAAWGNSIIEIWHDNKLIDVSRLSDWSFHCEVPIAKPLEARCIASNAQRILIPLIETDP